MGKLVAEHTRVVVVVSRQGKQSSQVAREAQSRILDKPAAAVDKPSIADSSHAAAVDRGSVHTVAVVAVHTPLAVVVAVHTPRTRSVDTQRHTVAVPQRLEQAPLSLILRSSTLHTARHIRQRS